ncbi:cytochrome-c peroxidase [Abyssalbus ytuae]|uniref:C-type cytochrome n=1 Tax=Abyssalbus ytuae TaxID=2926907 RepID=A0A9E6ZQW1_9FLAO|nr:cytochrome c peroxidase [Abyssalbus ytuae]UOB19264.1 c-type cytochrome [Abyssalbus ytuae]
MKKIIFLLIALSIVACKKERKENLKVTKPTQKTELQLQANNFFKPISSLAYEVIPENKIELGKKLYFDTRLSKDGNISCNSCHNLNTFGVDNLPTSPGDTRELGSRNSPSVIYASLHAKQFWDGRAKDVEEQAGMPILNPVEHNIPSEEFLVSRVKDIEEYQELFKEVYPDEENPVTFKNLTGAIGAFERQFLPESRFDKWLEGDETALNKHEKDGLKAFIDNGCIACHNGVALGGQLMQKFGLYGNYWEFTKSKLIDAGLYDLTKKDSDKYIFKTPSLRNIEKTYPYFHDGSIDSLEEAVKIMAKLQNNKEPSEIETKNIVSFLKTLTADIDDKHKTL